MENVIRLAVIGVGAMGSQHVKDIQTIPGVQLSAVCDLIPERMDVFSSSGVKTFSDYQEMLNSVAVDGVLIATPHYQHTPIAVDCFRRGIHVLTEKPIAAHMSDGLFMVREYKHAIQKFPKLIFAIMFQQRTYGYWQKIKQMIDNDELGKLIRATWVITNWFRNQSYYDNGDWRATWKGEGGGVLINQCPHNLDLFQWFFGMPEKVTGFAGLGKYHEIEVEDEVTAFFNYQNGMVGHFITSTAESPGTNRLEIVGEKGKLVFENNNLKFWKNNISMLDQIRTSKDPYACTETIEMDIPFDHHGQPGHKIVIENFVNATRGKEEVIIHGEEGLNQLHLSNAILLSSLVGKTIQLPMDAELFKCKLEAQIRSSKGKKKNGFSEIPDISKSFGN